MAFKKIAGPIRLVSGTNGADVEMPLPPRPGARMCKQAQYTLNIVSSGGAAPKLGFKLRHGPDGVVSKEIVNVASVAIPADNVAMFDSGSAMLCDVLHPVPVVGGSATGDWVGVEIYEMRKPF